MYTELIPGLEFVKKYNLTQKEIIAVMMFFEQPYTTQILADKLNVHKTTLDHIIQRLKLKKLIILKDRDSKGTYLYEFNSALIQEEI